MTKKAIKATKASLFDGAIKVTFFLGDTKLIINAYELLAKAGSPMMGALAAVLISVLSMYLLKHAYQYAVKTFLNKADNNKEINDYQLSFISGTLALTIAKAMTAKGCSSIIELGSVAIGFFIVILTTAILLLTFTWKDLWKLRVNLIARVLVMAPSTLIGAGRYDLAVAVIISAIAFVYLFGGLQGKEADEIEYTCKGDPIKKSFDDRMVNGLGYWTSGVIGSWIVSFYDATRPALTLQEPWVLAFGIIYVLVFTYCTDLKSKGVRSTFTGVCTSQASSTTNNCLKGVYPVGAGVCIFIAYTVFYSVLTLAGLKLKKGRCGLGYKRRKRYTFYLSK